MDYGETLGCRAFLLLNGAASVTICIKAYLKRKEFPGKLREKTVCIGLWYLICSAKKCKNIPKNIWIIKEGLRKKY